ncbi:MAG: HDIG domain-containing protein [Spirochaetes bacterium]|jgi:putative nucleotidyltransferase with HDIG domain|nr:HDIG domain-containing protein [Spirochaetota bacterium]
MTGYQLSRPEAAYIPSETECRELMERCGMLENIRRHSEQVRNVCLAIVDGLADPSAVDRGLVAAAALLHDIAKTRTIGTGERRHDLIGAEMLRDLGMDERIACAVESHVAFENFDAGGRLEEREIVFYADKRVMHDTVVTVDDRVADLAERYGINEYIRNIIIENKEFVLKVEGKIRGFMKTDMESALAGI